MQEQVLFSEVMPKASSLVVSAFDLEYLRIPGEENRNKVFTTLSKLYHDTKLYAFFTLRNLEQLQETLFSDVLTRDFVLNLTERVSLSWEGNRELYVKAVIRSAAPMRAQWSNYCLINKEVVDSLYTEDQTFTDLLTNNTWLVAIYLLMMHFASTTVYQSKATST